MHVTAFEKNHHAYARSIVDGIAFYIENQALGHVNKLGGSANI
jgi:hypothetical protein